MKSPMARRKNRMVSEPKTTCPATCKRSVPTNITAVNKPHIARYAAIAVSLDAAPPPNLPKKKGLPQRKQKQAVGKKCGGGERVALPPFHDTSVNLRRTAVANSHGQYHAVEFVEPGVVQVKQDSGHAEAKQP